jgi:hypothetical protein
MHTLITETRRPIEINTDKISANVATMLSFVRSVEHFLADIEVYRILLHDEVEFTEYPNLITKFGQIRKADAGLKGISIGRQILQTQQYQFLNIIDAGETVTAEILWTATMAIDAGHLKKGQELKAHICMIVEFKDGKIYRQRNYDCYDPFAE